MKYSSIPSEHRRKRQKNIKYDSNYVIKKGKLNNFSSKIFEEYLSKNVRILIMQVARK